MPLVMSRGPTVRKGAATLKGSAVNQSTTQEMGIIGVRVQGYCTSQTRHVSLLALTVRLVIANDNKFCTVPLQLKSITRPLTRPEGSSERSPNPEHH